MRPLNIRIDAVRTNHLVHGPRAPVSFLTDVEARCRPRLFDDADRVLDYVRLRLNATKPIRPAQQVVAGGATS